MLAHELGHLFGAHHDDDDNAFMRDDDGTSYDWAQGYANAEQDIYTVMA